MVLMVLMNCNRFVSIQIINLGIASVVTLIPIRCTITLKAYDDTGFAFFQAVMIDCHKIAAATENGTFPQTGISNIPHALP